MQLGAFQPLDRLHSHHGKRLPWEYPEPARTVAADFLRLREALVPYLYTLAREAHDSGLPMARPLYLRWARRPRRYDHPTQYTLGRDVLVAPVSAPGNPAETEVWFPPGVWVDWFTGERHRGPADEAPRPSRSSACPCSSARAGSCRPSPRSRPRRRDRRDRSC